jgi:hypothetical protein
MRNRSQRSAWLAWGGSSEQLERRNLLSTVGHPYIHVHAPGTEMFQLSHRVGPAGLRADATLAVNFARFMVDLRPVLAHSHVTRAELTNLMNAENAIAAQIHAPFPHELNSAPSLLVGSAKTPQEYMANYYALMNSTSHAIIDGYMSDQDWANSERLADLVTELQSLGISQDVKDEFLTSLRTFAVSVGTTVDQESRLNRDFQTSLDSQENVLGTGQTYPWDLDPHNFINERLFLFVHRGSA